MLGLLLSGSLRCICQDIDLKVLPQCVLINNQYNTYPVSLHFLDTVLLCHLRLNFISTLLTFPHFPKLRH